MKNTLFICTGGSGSGKSYFIEHYLPAPTFYKLRSMTTRGMRPEEQNGREYDFVNQDEFEKCPRATTLWVNEPNTPKWMYGVPEKQILDNVGRNLVYDVIQPKYARQMHDWFVRNNLINMYDVKVLWFISPENSVDIMRQRANMPDDILVRTRNTCNPIDFLRAGITPDFFVKCSVSETIIPPELISLISGLQSQKCK